MLHVCPRRCRACPGHLDYLAIRKPTHIQTCAPQKITARTFAPELPVIAGTGLLGGCSPLRGSTRETTKKGENCPSLDSNARDRSIVGHGGMGAKPRPCCGFRPHTWGRA